MNFDLQTTAIVFGLSLLVLLLVWLLLRSLSRKQSIAPTESEQEVADPYAGTRERPYMKAAPAAAAVEPPTGEAPLHFQARDIKVDGVPVPSFAAPGEPAPAPPPSAAPPPPAAPQHEAAPPAPIIPSEFGGIAFPPGATDHQDDLTRLKGVGPKLAAMLHAEGITQYAQLASLDDDELAAIDARLGNFRGRLIRDRVPEQARLLASGDREGFEATFGRLGG